MKRLLCLSVLFLALPLAASQGQATSSDCAARKTAIMFGDPGCHEGGCQDKSTPCKECRADGACWCSTCCVAARERLANVRQQDGARKSNLRPAARLAGPNSREP